MAVKDYREVYIATILKLSIAKEMDISRTYLASLTFEELKELSMKLQV